MTPAVSKLRNGLRIVSHRMPNLETVSLGLWAGAGARHESERQNGLSHLLEHMAFKGTVTRSARRIAEEIEDAGGELNAATGLEVTAYFARVLAGDEGVALTLLADILLNSKFADGDLEREREVIQQEIAAAQDTPEDIAYDLMQATAYPAQAIGRAILGTRESVGAIEAADLRAFLEKRYVPDCMVIAAAGAIDHEALVRHVEALFGGLSSVEPGEESSARYVGGAAATGKRFEQSHLLIGFPAPSYLDSTYPAAQVFSGLFGGGMSSRLFQEIRENRGLCYSIYSTAWGLRDTGMIAIHAATAPDMVLKLSQIAAAELDDIADKGPTDAELVRSKSQLKAGLLMALENSAVYAEQMARQLLAHGRLISPSELASEVTHVTADDVQRLAIAMRGSVPTVAIVGPGRRSLAAASQIPAFFGAGAIQRAAGA